MIEGLSSYGLGLITLLVKGVLEAELMAEFSGNEVLGCI